MKFFKKSIYSIYHWFWSFGSAVWYRFPSRQIKVIAVTGTKGKTTTTELISVILEKAGHKTAISSTLRFKIGDQTERNTLKMSMPGRGFLQHFLRRAVNADCDYAVMEMTSQGVLQHRHRFIALDTLVFTNISPEHIESHGSFEKYLAAKLAIACSLGHSPKPKRTIVVNGDDAAAEKFLEAAGGAAPIIYRLADAEPFEAKPEGVTLTIGGQTTASPLSGLFNIYNILAAAAAVKSQGVADEVIRQTVKNFTGVAGRVEKILSDSPKQNFDVVVDYAHTPDSLTKIYEVFAGRRVIGVLGGTGGGRDKWKRQEMGTIADRFCSHIILTDEDPYDEDPRQIVEDVKTGISEKPCEIIMDRRAAIARAISRAQAGDVVVITGKGTDPYIMGPRGAKTPWSDADVAREELLKL